MRGCRGNDFQATVLLQFAKSGKQIAFAFINKEAAGLVKTFEIELRELTQCRMFTAPLSFARSEINQSVQMPDVTLTK